MKRRTIAKTFFKNEYLMLGSAASAGARITTVVTMVLTTAIATRVMTEEEFGFWAILISFIYLSAIFDFGFRYGMGNRLAALVAISNGMATAEQKELFISTFFFQGAIAILLSLMYLAVSPLVPWVEILKIHQPDLVKNVHLLMNIVFIALFLNIPFILAGSGFFAYQEVNLICLFIAGQSIMLLFLFWFTTLIISFRGVIACYFVTYLLSNVISTIWFFKRRRWTLLWPPLAVQFEHVRSFINRSFEFFIQSSAGTIIANVSLFLAGTVAGLSKAGDFNLVQKIFGFMITLHLAILAPLAPVYTQAARLGNWELVQKKFSYCKHGIWPLLFIGGGSVIYIFHPIILRLWTGRNLTDFTLAGLIALYAVLVGWVNTQSVLLNSLGLVKWQAIAFVLQAPIFIFLPLYMGKIWGVTGVALGSLLCMIPGTFLWPLYANYALKLRLLKV